MKLLVVGPDIQDIRKVKNFTGIYAYYLAREFRARGVELVFADGKHPEPLRYLADVDPQGADHVLAFGLRWFTHQPIGCAAILKTKVPGAVTMLHDGLVHDGLTNQMAGVDCTFMFRDDALRVRDWKRYAKSNHYIGWGSDPELLFPEQRPEERRILIDHQFYKGGHPDHTNAIVHDAMLFATAGSWKKHHPKANGVSVRRLINGGAEDVTLENMTGLPFNRMHVPFPDICREYRRAHVYMVTHRESVGLTCLELATCGALVVAPMGMIYSDRLATIRHIEFAGVRIPWSEIMRAIDIKASVEQARLQTWPKVADRLLNWFAEYR